MRFCPTCRCSHTGYHYHGRPVSLGLLLVLGILVGCALIFAFHPVNAAPGPEITFSGDPTDPWCVQFGCDDASNGEGYPMPKEVPVRAAGWRALWFLPLVKWLPGV